MMWKHYWCHDTNRESTKLFIADATFRLNNTSHHAFGSHIHARHTPYVAPMGFIVACHTNTCSTQWLRATQAVAPHVADPTFVAKLSRRPRTWPPHARAHVRQTTDASRPTVGE